MTIDPRGTARTMRIIGFYRHFCFFINLLKHEVARLVQFNKALCFKPEGRGFDSRVGTLEIFH